MILKGGTTTSASLRTQYVFVNVKHLLWYITCLNPKNSKYKHHTSQYRHIWSYFYRSICAIYIYLLLSSLRFSTSGFGYPQLGTPSYALRCITTQLSFPKVSRLALNCFTEKITSKGGTQNNHYTEADNKIPLLRDQISRQIVISHHTRVI